MPERIEIRKEAIARQGTIVKGRRAQYFIEGDQQRAKFQMGEEGLVHWAVEQPSGTKYRIKLFWQPDDTRLARSRHLVKQELAKHNSSTDVLGGAPFALLDSIGGLSRFALIMKNVDGGSWKDLRQDAEQSGVYPPPDWPSFNIRLLWAYALACAVERMEARNFVHADLSDGNVLVVSNGPRAGQLALVDFDAYYNPDFPSDYRGTSGFVAPEIWNRGAIGVGSDRVAMAILIQEFLLVGDPELTADGAFNERYTQDQICTMQYTAHPQLRRKYGAVADLVDATLTAASRELRPEPKVWRETLRPLFRQGTTQNVRLTSSTGETALLVALRPGEKKDLMETPFSIRGDIVRLSDGTLRLRPHPGAILRLQLSHGTWREIEGATEVAITGDSQVYDREGKGQAQLTIDQSTQEASPSTLVPETFDDMVAEERVNAAWFDRVKSSIPQIEWKKAGIALLAVVAIVLLLLLIGRTVSFFSNTRPSKTPTREVSDTTAPEAAHDRPVKNPAPTAPRPEPGHLARDPDAIRPAPLKIPPVKLEPVRPPAKILPSPPVESPLPVPLAERPKPPTVESTQPPPIHSANSPADRPPIQRPEAPVYRGPTSGDFVWSGTVEKNQEIEIKNGTANIGSVSGTPLPGVPVVISIDNNRMAVISQPNPLNHFAAMGFRSSFKGQVRLTVHWTLLPGN